MLCVKHVGLLFLVCLFFTILGIQFVNIELTRSQGIESGIKQRQESQKIKTEIEGIVEVIPEL